MYATTNHGKVQAATPSGVARRGSGRRPQGSLYEATSRGHGRPPARQTVRHCAAPCHAINFCHRPAPRRAVRRRCIRIAPLMTRVRLAMACRAPGSLFTALSGSTRLPIHHHTPVYIFSCGERVAGRLCASAWPW